MSSPIEDYAIIGDAHTVALVGRDGSIDWWCAPRIDSGASFAALLGDDAQRALDRAPRRTTVCRSTRRVRPDTMVLETIFETADGAVAVIDFMPRSDLEHPTIVRVVRGLRGHACACGSELVVRFDYGSIVPWVRHTTREWRSRGGADGVALHSRVG